MKIGWVGLVAVLVACSAPEPNEATKIGASISDAPVSGPIHFRFAPTDGAEFVETIFDRFRRDCPAVPTLMLEVEQQLAAKVRQAESGWELARKGLSVRSWFNGARYNDPYLAHLVGAELVHRYDGGGALLAVDGLRDLVRAIRATVPDGPVAFRPVGIHRSAERLFEAQWERIGRLAGSTVAIGDTVETEFPVVLGDGSIVSVPEKITVARYAACPAGRCVLLWLDAESSDGAVAVAAVEAVKEILRADPDLRRLAGNAIPKPAGSDVVVSETVVLDPATMLVYQESGSMDVRFTIDVPDHGPASYRVAEEWRRSFDYSAVSGAQARAPE